MADCEFGIVDVALDANELAIAGLAHAALQRAEQRRVGLRIPERLARRVERGDAAFGQEEAHRPVHPVEPLADPAPDALVLLRRGAHQRDLRIVNVEFALAIAFGNRVGRAEIDHVERADRADEGHAAADDRAKAVVGGRKHAAHQEIADFRRREIDDGGQHAGIDQLLHRAAADAGGVEDETFEIVAQVGRDLLHGRRRHAEHGDADGRQIGRRVAFGLGLLVETRLHHAGDARWRRWRAPRARSN